MPRKPLPPPLDALVTAWLTSARVTEYLLENLDDEHRDLNADNLSRRQLFGRHPLGYPITGTLANVERFTERDLGAHLQRYYRASNMVVAVCSPLPPAG